MNYNLATKSDSEQKALQRDLKAALWAHNVKRGKLTTQHVLQRIAKLSFEQAIDMRSRFDNYMDLEWRASIRA